MDGLRIPLSSPSLVSEVWDKLFEGYFDHDELLASVKYGWDLSFKDSPEPRDSQWNHPSATSHEHDVQAYIDKELRFGAMVGPFTDQDLPFPVFASPMGSVPKSNSDTTRTITDCSQHGAGINHRIDATGTLISPLPTTLS